MLDDQFWALLEQTRPAGPADEDHDDALAAALATAGVDATVAWGHSLDEAMDAIDHWDLWGAAYLVLGGCSDDSYEYLRAWVVSRGRATWERARTEPEGLFVDLFAGAVDPEGWAARLGDLDDLDAEGLLYAAGTAHQRLTGEWLPPHEGLDARRSAEGRPRGEGWDEDDLPDRFPRLTALLPDGWAETVAAGPDPGLGFLAGPSGIPAVTVPGLDDLFSRLPAVTGQVDACVGAFHSGDHRGAIDACGALIDDAEAWAVVRQIGAAVDVAYVGGMSRFIEGDPDGASEWLRLVAADDPPPHVRRGLAQIEMARGDLEATRALLETGPGAHPLDRALAVAVAHRRGDADEARALAAALWADLASTPIEHPWDRAGLHVQLGFVAAHLGDAAATAAEADQVQRLTADAPPEVPLVAEGHILRAAARRLAGDLEGASVALRAAWPLLGAGTVDLGQAQLEHARLQAARGDAAGARQAYGAAVATFAAAGERWQADAAAAEAGQDG